MISEETVRKILQFTEDRDWDQFHSPENLAKSVAIEAGELLECFQWSGEYDPEHTAEELADVMNYCIQLADKLGLDMDQIRLDKLEKNAKKYPVEKAKGSNRKYTELDREEER
ncbi:MAG: nucleotide pyrophosphohydrolase [Erysipelotrichaceae bacterium]|nr:nucleotide pyrophosphohydrolase [Erysipelotrichaceae bacterium]